MLTLTNVFVNNATINKQILKSVSFSVSVIEKHFVLFHFFNAGLICSQNSIYISLPQEKILYTVKKG